jgi:hypothetical protein
MKTGVVAALGIALAWAALAVAQLWLNVFSGEIFLKLTITAGILVVAIVLVTLAVREYVTNKDLKSRGFMDGD